MAFVLRKHVVGVPFGVEVRDVDVLELVGAGHEGADEVLGAAATQGQWRRSPDCTIFTASSAVIVFISGGIVSYFFITL